LDDLREVIGRQSGLLGRCAEASVAMAAEDKTKLVEALIQLAQTARELAGALKSEPLLPDLSFGAIWSRQISALRGQVLERENATTNEIVSVDASGLTRRTSNGKIQRIKADTFRWAIERLIAGETVLREDINDHGGGRASSGILLILSALPQFESTSLAGNQALRLARQQPDQ
jgi:hypothetical protein